MAGLAQEERAAAILRRRALTDDDIDQLSQFNSLRDLKFAAGSTFPPATFARLARLRWLQFLQFESSAFSAQEMRDLSAIGTLRSLIFLNCQLGDAEIRHFAVPPRLDRLWLDGSQITDASLPHIASFASLTWLSLGGTCITDAGLAQLRPLGQLKLLYLHATSITDAGLLSLTVLPRLKLAAPRGAITEAGIAAFRAAQREETFRQKHGMAPPPVDSAVVAAATGRLREFVAAMHAWGEYAIEISQQIPPAPRSTTAVQDSWELMRERLSAVMATFCTPKARPMGKPEYFSVSTPPAYDPNQLSIREATQPNGRTVVIVTIEARNTEYQYVLKQRGAQWFIDSRQCWTDGRWRPGYL
jgi:hypothetical protein